MTLRERLADWISGGAVTAANRRADKMYDEADKWLNRYYDELERRYGQRAAPTLDEAKAIARGEG